MQIEAGKYYRNRRGNVIGPIEPEPHRVFCFSGSIDGKSTVMTFTKSGGYHSDGEPHDLDLVDEWPQEEHAAAPDATGKAARTIYLSGPMKGYPGKNYPLFNMVAARLRDAGHQVYNPAEFKADRPCEDAFPIREAFAAYSKFICEEADTIVLLPGWESSKGANAERALAENCGIEIIPFDQLSIAI